MLVLKATVGDGLKYWVPKWEEETGGKVNVAEVPIDTLHQQIFSDLQTTHRYDTYMTGAWFYGDFFVPKEPYIVPLEPFLKRTPKYPYWNPDDWIPAMKTLYTWEDKVYGALFDRGDCQILYYRKDVFDKPENQQKFKDKMGYDFPNPPKTMKEMQDVATFYTGWDWNGDGKDDWGISLHAKVNEQGFFHFLTLAAPYVVARRTKNKYFWFNPDTMKPLINSASSRKAAGLPCLEATPRIRQLPVPAQKSSAALRSGRPRIGLWRGSRPAWPSRSATSLSRWPCRMPCLARPRPSARNRPASVSGRPKPRSRGSLSRPPKSMPIIPPPCNCVP